MSITISYSHQHGRISYERAQAHRPSGRVPVTGVTFRSNNNPQKHAGPSMVLKRRHPQSQSNLARRPRLGYQQYQHQLPTPLPSNLLPPFPSGTQTYSQPQAYQREDQSRLKAQLNSSDNLEVLEQISVGIGINSLCPSTNSQHTSIFPSPFGDDSSSLSSTGFFDSALPESKLSAKPMKGTEQWIYRMGWEEWEAAA